MLAKPRLVFDIETTCNPDSCALMPEPEIEAPANYKDPVKIAEYIAEKAAAKKAEMLDRAALDPDYGKILSIGMSIGDEITVLVNRCLYDGHTAETGEILSVPPDAVSEESLLKLS